MDVLEEARNKALDLGSVTLSDFRRFAGLDYRYTDIQTWWTYESLRHTGVARLREGYGIMLPPPSSRPMNKYTPKPTPKPLTITLDYAGIDADDFNHVLAKAFQYAQTITDREVEINIC
jgi:hypothetical protein